jgi:hypothetical protein
LHGALASANGTFLFANLAALPEIVPGDNMAVAANCETCQIDRHTVARRDWNRRYTASQSRVPEQSTAAEWVSQSATDPAGLSP